MIIKVTEGKRGWNLWVTDMPGIDQPPIVTASGRTHEQITAILRTLFVEADAARMEATPAPVPASPPTTGSTWSANLTKQVVQSNALHALLVNLDGWIQGAKENHEALGHRNENRGEECWRSFAPADFRAMVNDTCRELGISEFEFPIPSPGVEG